ncbi:MAG: acyl-[acyl-carrier-protein]--UDP-N-acetylglucosamine O-acyltransferase [Candidatus Cloacimonetes bacterium HGW-Cloacimonetes-1]|jgi:UDP-N-acetylglucosamine acyltransferase|nr:MAG: acyl-[acyl-carrier-protein]--UDP-N-acetylglucosamine O-acyltransferase [Candidatus Cloacimonetes bacterium HGW-Cloacimonetes-1]
MTIIHPTAIVDPNAKIGSDCFIGPYCTIGKNVVLGDNNYLVSSVVIDGYTTIGNGNKIFPFAILGTDPQDLKFKGEATRLNIGDNNTIREFVTVNRSNQMEEDTNVGSNNLLMEYLHVGHNCQIGNGCVIANAVQLAGHVHIHDNAIIGGQTAIHQFVHIGTHSFVGGASAIKKDIVPYTRGQGNPYKTVGLNSVGLVRKGFSNEQVAAIKAIYNLYYRKGLNVSQATENVGSLGNLTVEQTVFLNFVKNSDRGLSN